MSQPPEFVAHHDQHGNTWRILRRCPTVHADPGPCYQPYATADDRFAAEDMLRRLNTDRDQAGTVRRAKLDVEYAPDHRDPVDNPTARRSGNPARDPYNPAARNADVLTHLPDTTETAHRPIHEVVDESRARADEALERDPNWHGR